MRPDPDPGASKGTAPPSTGKPTAASFDPQSDAFAAPAVDGPLKGLRVLELAAVLAGPSVGSFLAELGASVLKVEHPGTGGDVTRGWRLPGEPCGSEQVARADAKGLQDQALSVSAYYASANFGKQVLLADLKDPKDALRVKDIVAQSDVVIGSFRPGADRRLGLDPQTLMAAHPRLVVARISGYGPDQSRAAYDLVLQAETGWMSMNGPPDASPSKLPVALVDVLAAHQLKQAILLALLQREKDGKGRLVEVSLYDASLSALANQASNWLMAGHSPGPMGSLHPNIAPYGECFPCSDGHLLVLAVGAESHFETLCKILEISPLNEDPRFASNAERVRHRSELQELLAPAFKRRSRKAWLDAFSDGGVPAGAVHALPEVFAAPAAQAMVLDDERGRRVRQVAFRMPS